MSMITLTQKLLGGVELIYFKGFVFYPYEDSENIKQKIKSTHKIIQHKNE